MERTIAWCQSGENKTCALTMKAAGDVEKIIGHTRARSTCIW